MDPHADPPATFVPVTFFHDYVDPASYLVDRWLRRREEGAGVRVRRRPFEIRRPPAPIVDAGGEAWSDYVSRIRSAAAEENVPLSPPRIVPWSRKAHELALHAEAEDRFDAVHDGLYAAYFVEGADIGRVDVLVEVAARAGLDRSEVKVALDVDRYRDPVEELRRAAEADGVRGVPTIVGGGTRLEGFHPKRDVLTFLDRASVEDAGGKAGDA